MAGGRAVRRLVQHLVIPAAAAGVVAWGAFGVEPPSPLRWWERSAAGTPLVGATATADATMIDPGNESTPPIEGAASPAGTPLPTPAPPLLTWPATPATPAGSPAATPMPPADLVAPRLATRSPGTVPRAITPVPPTLRAGPSPTPPSVVGCAEPPSPPPVSGAATRATTTATNLRAQPGLDCGILTVLASGTEVRVLNGEVRADGRTWLRVRVADAEQIGWVASELLRDVP